MQQIRSVSLYSFLDVSRSVGVDGLALLREAGIASSDLERSDARLPAAPVVEMLERAATLSGCDSFGIRMAQCRSFASLGSISLLLERLQDVGEILSCLESLYRTLSDVLIVSTEIHDEVVTALFDLVAPLSKPQAAQLTVGLGYLALRGASRGQWVPEAVHFSHSKPGDLESFQRFFGVPLLFESEFNGFSFEKNALTRQLPLADKEMAQNARWLLRDLGLPAIKAPASDHAKHSIALLLRHGRTNVSEVAKNLGKTERVFQRQLRSEGTSFADILCNVRRELAISLLRQSSQNLTMVSQSLGYANLSSFTRWFEREFGASPSQWLKLEREKMG